MYPLGFGRHKFRLAMSLMGKPQTWIARSLVRHSILDHIQCLERVIDDLKALYGVRSTFLGSSGI